MPSNLLLHDNEGKLVFLNERDPTQMFIFDLEEGKVVQKIATGKQSIKFEQINNDEKNGQKDISRTLIGCESRGLFTIDTRIADNSIVNDKIYKTNVMFQTITPASYGAFVVGSANGDIRLFSKMGQVAKSMLPGLGEPIKAIDVSQDKRWLLITCQTYLLVMPTDNSDGVSGF